MTASTAASPRQTRASPVSTPAATGQSQLEAAVARLRENARKFTRLSLDQRAQLARSMQAGYLRHRPRQLSRPPAAPRASLSARRWRVRNGPWALVRRAAAPADPQSLLALKHTGNTPIGEVGRTVDQRIASAGLPRGNHRRDAVSEGVRVDVHLQAGITESEMNASTAPGSTSRRRSRGPSSAGAWRRQRERDSHQGRCSPRCSTRGRSASSR